MQHGLERFVVPATYGIGVVLWAVVLGVLLARLRRPPDVNRLFFVLVVVLSIDAFRTLLENAYFGVYWNAVYGVLPSDLRILLEVPALVVLPRLVNLLTGGLILFLIVWRWLPAAETDRIDLARRTSESSTPRPTSCSPWTMLRMSRKRARNPGRCWVLLPPS
jgi:hypothetical protein